MASKVLVPTTAPFAKLQLKKSSSESSGSGFIIGNPDAASRVAHLEHSVRFLQEQHRLMLSGLHAEIEALRERNRDLQFQLIFNKESSSKASSPATNEDIAENGEERRLRREVSRLEREGAAARGEARAAEARALQLQRLVDQQAEKLRELELKAQTASAAAAAADQTRPGREESAESRAELRAKLADAERLVRRLRGDADRQRRELQCMKNSLHASLRAGGLEPGFGYQNNYHFPPVPLTDFWREPLRDEFGGGSRRRPLTLPELSAAGQHLHRATIYANQHTTRPRGNAYENKNKKPLAANGETVGGKSPDEPPDRPRFKTICTNELTKNYDKLHKDSAAAYPELKIVVTKLISHENVTVGSKCEGNTRVRPKRHQHRKHAADST